MLLNPPASTGQGRLCASWQCPDPPRGPPPTLGVQFVGSGASLSGLDVELVGSKYCLSLVKKRFTTGTEGEADSVGSTLGYGALWVS